jgi:hypothetical protein
MLHRFIEREEGGGRREGEERGKRKEKDWCRAGVSDPA